ncbi:ATP-dependent RNA helicase [Hortaea werneckii]|nr:ATP-dependent RNA helicase [Hortaea werneckii]
MSLSAPPPAHLWDFFFFFLGISFSLSNSSASGVSLSADADPFIGFEQLLVRGLEHMNTVFESLHFGPFVQHLLSKILQLRFDGAHVDFVHLSAYILEIFTVPFQAFLSFIDSLQQSLFSSQSLPPLLLDFGAIFAEGRNLDHCGLVFGLDIFKFRHDLFAHFGESLIEIAFAQSSDLLSQGGDVAADRVRIDGHAHALVDAPKVVKWSHDQCLANAGPRKGLNAWKWKAWSSEPQYQRSTAFIHLTRSFTIISTRFYKRAQNVRTFESSTPPFRCMYAAIASSQARCHVRHAVAVKHQKWSQHDRIGTCNSRFCQYEHTSNVHWHLLDLSAVELLNLTHHAHIVGSDEVDSDTLPTETATTTDTVDVVLPVGRKVVVDDQRNLLHVDTTGKQIGGDQDTGRARAELLHDHVTLALVHVTVHGRHGEVTGSELVGEPVDLSAGVTEDDGLGDGDSLVQVGERVELPLLLLDGNVELLDTFKGKLVLLDENTHRLAHELGGDLKDILRHGSREQDDLGGLWQELEDVVDLLSETARQHLVGLVEDEHLHAVGLQHAALDHVVDTARSANNDLRAVLQRLHVVPHAGATNAGVALNVHEVANGHDDLLDLLSQLTGRGEDQTLASLDVRVELLEGGDSEGSGLAGTRLGLSDHIVALDDGHDRTLLNRGWALETVGVNAAEQLAPEVHRVEGVGGLIVVRLDLSRLYSRDALTDVLKSLVSHVCGVGIGAHSRCAVSCAKCCASRLVLVCESVSVGCVSASHFCTTKLNGSLATTQQLSHPRRRFSSASSWEWRLTPTWCGASSKKAEIIFRFVRSPAYWFPEFLARLENYTTILLPAAIPSPPSTDCHFTTSL